MGTNYYRIPTSREMLDRHQKLMSRVNNLDYFDPTKIEAQFSDIDDFDDIFSKMSPWDEFLRDTKVHLGKRSGGWRFCWNFNNNRFYSNKEELFKYIRSGRVVDEYGTLIDTEQFIEMALNWCPDGRTVDETYFKDNRSSFWSDWKRHLDREVDGLRVSSSVEFS